MPKKMPRRLVALSATAVASIYLAGLTATRGAADSVAAAAADSTASPAVASTAAPTSAPGVVVGASATLTPTTAATSTPATTTGYATGTYSGTGTSRFGNVSVSVTTAGGSVTNVQIVKVTTSFPVSRIASLPSQVIQNQTANVNSVTGATYSSQAFKQAVQQALAQAQVQAA
jgi:uncharacterized protein with FMN-binding domain